MRILRLKFLKYSEYVKNVYEANIFFQNIIPHVEDLAFECEVTGWFCSLNKEIILSKVG